MDRRLCYPTDPALRATVILIAVLLILPGLLFAQDFDSAATEATTGMIEEVVVTARKREESLQETPIAISAFTSEELKDAGIHNTRDLEENVPGLTFTELGAKSPAIFIRGVGQREANAALDPGVGIYINGVYIPRADTQLLDTVDINSIQVLRGPQGTLFGKNTTGGALLITTKTPQIDSFEGEAGVRVGNFERRDFYTNLNIPLSEEHDIAMTLGFNSTNLDGYIDNDINGKTYGDENRDSATSRVLWQVNDGLSADFFTYWSRQRERGTGFNCKWLGNDEALFALFTVSDGQGNTGSSEDFCRSAEPLANNWKTAVNEPTATDLDNSISSVNLNWDLDELEILSITSYSFQENIFTEEDLDATQAIQANNGNINFYAAFDNDLNGSRFPQNNEKRDQITQEIQLTGHLFDDSLVYTTGVFYAYEKIDNFAFSQNLGVNGYSVATLGLSSFVLPIFRGTTSDMTNETLGIYSQFTYDLSDSFQLTVGGRYSAEDRERDAEFYGTLIDKSNTEVFSPADGEDLTDVPDVLEILDASTTPLSPYVVSDVSSEKTEDIFNGEVDLPLYLSSVDKKSDTFSNFTPSATLAYTAPDDILGSSNVDSLLAYFTISTGFKAGGFEPVSGELLPYNQEEVLNFEIGIKADLYDRRIRINSAVYRMDYDDIQVRVTRSGAVLGDVISSYENAGGATIQGFETEITALLPYNLILNSSVSYIDAGYDEFEGVLSNPLTGTNTIVDRSDEPFASTPEVTYSLALTHIASTNIGEFQTRLSTYYRDKIYTGLDVLTADFEDAATLDSYTLYNFRLQYVPSRADNLYFAVYVDNISDEQYFAGGFSTAETIGIGEYILGPGRTYGIEASYSF